MSTLSDIPFEEIDPDKKAMQCAHCGKFYMHKLRGEEWVPMKHGCPTEGAFCAECGAMLIIDDPKPHCEKCFKGLADEAYAEACVQKHYPGFEDFKCVICEKQTHGIMHNNDKEPICTPCFDAARKHREKVNHPGHYGGKNNPYEAWKVIEAHELNFNLGNVVKYVIRAGKKKGNSTLLDLKKAKAYLDREVERMAKGGK